MIPETWTEQRARLELMTISEADYVMGDQGRAAIKEALRRLDAAALFAALHGIADFPVEGK